MVILFIMKEKISKRTVFVCNDLIKSKLVIISGPPHWLFSLGANFYHPIHKIPISKYTQLLVDINSLIDLTAIKIPLCILGIIC